MYYIIIYSLLFNMIFRMLSIEYDTKMAQNFTCGLHILISLCINLFFVYYNQFWIYQLGVLITTGYYIFDIFYLYYYKKLNVMNAALFYHHLATIYYIQLDPYLYLGHLVLIAAEISNIPAIFIYHYLKSNPETPKLSWWLKVQKYVYIFIRIPILFTMGYIVWTKTLDNISMMIVAPVLLMGIIWSIKLVTQ